MSTIDSKYIKQFEDIFKIPFASVVNISDLGADEYDDGELHYLQQETLNVYSFDTYDNEWLEMNENKDDVLKSVKEALDFQNKYKGVDTTIFLTNIFAQMELSRMMRRNQCVK